MYNNHYILFINIYFFKIENEVIIIGAGPAGIGAGRYFLKYDIKPLILEA